MYLHQMSLRRSDRSLGVTSPFFYPDSISVFLMFWFFHFVSPRIVGK
ncbi:hypothetical protein LEP1GSC060_0197 [Leptospira weilii serovar Ranarum str. ICFT]|uniref:Uncharacterized protein n=1 Tax=Leptospira weilii serovar Ranarum str. ICFT TaxID=1218598 RepID=N1W8D5_9LEPT|nr:hypothetical protein LEP1GSC060_0197 [Leptospira weilii serovar Ranarum str. ICFT]